MVDKIAAVVRGCGIPSIKSFDWSVMSLLLPFRPAMTGFVAGAIVLSQLVACGGASKADVADTAAGPTIQSLDEEGYSPPTSFSSDYCSSNDFPAQWEWRESTVRPQVRGAVSGVPLIRHLRDGRLIASYTKLGGHRSAPNNTDGHDASVGPFRRALFTQWKNGDVFEIYPAIYEGEDQQIYIGPNFDSEADYSSKNANVPKNITVRGITVNGVRPVIKLPATGASNATLGQSLIYIDKSEGITIENLEVISNDTGLGRIGKAGIYINGGKNVTLRNLRIHGFENRSANGIFGTSDNSGTMLIEGVELSGNGGGNGPEHNIYINYSKDDSKFTVKMLGSWSHDARYGHLFKSRAQVNILEGNYFQGSRATKPGEMRESYLVDVPDGGVLTARNNIFVKTASGDNTNGASLAYAAEGSIGRFDTTRPWALTVEHNTFVAFTQYFDNQKHQVYPFLLNAIAPVKAENINVNGNLFVGYCRKKSSLYGSPGYFGEGYMMADFNAIDQSFRPRKPQPSKSGLAPGSLGYQHKQSNVRRRTNAIGARD